MRQRLAGASPQRIPVMFGTCTTSSGVHGRRVRTVELGHTKNYAVRVDRRDAVGHVQAFAIELLEFAPRSRE